MTSTAIVDTGPLVALFDRRDKFHAFCVKAFSSIHSAVTCEAVITEAAFLLRKFPEAERALESMLREGFLRLPFRLEAEIESIGLLRRTYRNVPMSLADACLVRLYELTPNSTVVTLHSDFRVYRAHRRRRIKTLMPGQDD